MFKKVILFSTLVMAAAVEAVVEPEAAVVAAVAAAAATTQDPSTTGRVFYPGNWGIKAVRNFSKQHDSRDLQIQLVGFRKDRNLSAQQTSLRMPPMISPALRPQQREHSLSGWTSRRPSHCRAPSVVANRFRRSSACV